MYAIERVVRKLCVRGVMLLGCVGLSYAQGVSEEISRYEFSEALQRMQCQDCLVPTKQYQEKYTPKRLQNQKQDPQQALDDIFFPSGSGGDEQRYYCVAGVSDGGIMHGFPRTTSPYCPGKFCGTSFLTMGELTESLLRLVGKQVWKAYNIDWRQVGVWAKDAPAVTIPQRLSVAQALRRCEQTTCPAENTEEFDIWIRWCSAHLDICQLANSGSFSKEDSFALKVFLLQEAGVNLQSYGLRSRFDLVKKTTVETIIPIVQNTLSCNEAKYKDYDRDGVDNRIDICPYDFDVYQYDRDDDGIGDVCDPDIDNDGIPNQIGVVDAGGNIVPRLALLSADNCLIQPNTQQQNSDDDRFGNACDPDDEQYVGTLRALQIDADAYYGAAPFTVAFTPRNAGLQGNLEWDMGDGNMRYAQNISYIFEKPGIYPVKAAGNIQHEGPAVFSIVPITVRPDTRTQAGLEIVTKQFTPSASGTITVEHIGIGDIKKLTLRNGSENYTIDYKDSLIIPILQPGVQTLELQAYNSQGQWVSLSQLTVDTIDALGSYIHTSSLDPLVQEEVALTTIIGGFNETDVATVERDFGDGFQEQNDSLVTAHRWAVPGVYIIKQTIRFRDRTKTDHTNVISIVVQPINSGSKMHLVVDKLVKLLGEEFVFTLETEQIPIQNIQRCTWYVDKDRTYYDDQIIAADLVKKYSFAAPGSYPVVVLCQTNDKQWYHTAVTVAVDETSVCLQNSAQLTCDMDKDGIPDLCDDDIDGDGKKNWMGVLTKENSDCSITTGNVNQEILGACTQACAGGAGFDNCSFVSNPNQEDADQNGIGAACGGDGGTTAGGSSASAGSATATAGGTTAGGPVTGSTAGSPTAGGSSASAGSATAGTTTQGNQDSDGDGIGDGSDACGSTPESANGSSDADGCPEAPQDESSDPDVPDNPLIEVDTCTQCPCPEADYASSLWKGDRVRAMLLDEGGTIIYRYTIPEIIQEDIPDQLLGGEKK